VSLVACGGSASSATSSAGSASASASGSDASSEASGSASASGSTEEAAFPAKFDLRDRGVVTPVKMQNPWQSCWAFGSIAAAESSILSTLQEKGQAFDAKDFDMSEKHLVWFGLNPITEAVDPAQAGEGMLVTGADGDDPKAVYDNGGYGLNASTLFASGVGPVYEKYFPYQGDSGLTESQYLEEHPDLKKNIAVETCVGLTGMTPEEVVNELDEQTAAKVFDTLRSMGCLAETDNAKMTVEVLEQACIDLYLKNAAGNNAYTKWDDWSIPETMTFDGQEVLSRNVTSGFTLVDGNKLPSLFNKDADGKWESINQEGIDAVKSELMKGRGVSAGYQADQAAPGVPVPERYMSATNWAHYTYEDMGTSHMICIVGWDDDYSASNFLEGHQPPENGAWLVKNSWGSETDYVVNDTGAHIAQDAWGLENEEGKHTGYFWISYYDKSLNYCESMAFDTDLADAEGEMVTRMYDYMPSLIGVRTGEDTSEQSESLVKTANVFTNDIGYDAQLLSVSTKTAHPNATVKYSIYKLSDGFQNPEDGELLGTATATYDYAGFHREKLDGSIVLKPDETFAIVAEETVEEGGKTLYEYAANIAYTKAHAEAVQAKEAAEGVDSDDRDRNADEYGIAVVNKGESFIYDGGAWTDWTEYEPRTRLLDDYAIDNFSIKAYLVFKPE
jgi:hypothetical protein